MTDKEIMDYMEKGITVTRSIEILNPIQEKRAQSAHDNGYLEGLAVGIDLGKRKTITEALKIIDEVKSDANKGYMFDMVDEIKNRIMALKGEHG